MLNRLSYIFLLGTLALLAVLYIAYNRQDEAPARYMGIDRCRVCHEAASSGAQTKVWLRSAHSRAYQALESDSAKTIIAKLGGTNADCLRCHTTLGRAPQNEIERHLTMEGVSCERCHGPGSNYAYHEIMRHRSSFTAEGGVVGSLRDCYQCHAASVATDSAHCPFQYTDFNADSAWLQVRHPLPANPTRPDTAVELR